MRKTRPPRDVPPPLELECLKTLWTLGEANVQRVMTALAPRRSLAYTTVMTILERLARKGAVERRKVGRSFVYAPVLDRQTLRQRAVKDLVESLFNGSQQDLISYLLARETPLKGDAEAVAGALDPALL